MTKNIKLSLTFLFASMFILLLVMTIGEGLTGFLFILGLYAVLGIVAAVIFLSHSIEQRNREAAQQARALQQKQRPSTF